MTLWGGRFTEQADQAAFDLNASLSIDRRMAPQDVYCSRAWARGLEAAGVLSADQRWQIDEGLAKIAEEIAIGAFRCLESDEDIHSAVERRLSELVGPLAGMLHTGRSRNDQVVTDFRRWLLDHIPGIRSAIRELQQALLDRARADLGIAMPGYTHLQRAQPILLSHWWLSHFWPLQRDLERLDGVEQRTSVLPLGSGALAGAPFAIDRHSLAGWLDFQAVSANSIDAVSDRDFAAEFLFFAALLGVHLSRMAEAIILYTSAEFGFLELSDAYSTGSSLMPQKKNPDHFELARGKTGSLIGQLTGLLATLKGLPSAYDKDLQEDKAPVFAAADTLLALLPVLAGGLRTLRVHTHRLRAAIDAALFATELADYLVDRGVPFRQAHEATGRIVRLAESQDLALDRLSLEQFRSISDKIEADVYSIFETDRALLRRSAYGGTGLEVVKDQLDLAEESLGTAATDSQSGDSR